MRYFFLIIAALFLFSCQTTGYFIQDSNLPVSDTRKAVTALMGTPRAMSLNGREMFSEYHDSKFQYLDPELANKDHRFYTKVTILGPRRPYEIQIQVFLEKYELETDGFVTVGVNEDLSFRRAATLQKSLKAAEDTSMKLQGDAPF